MGVCFIPSVSTMPTFTVKKSAIFAIICVGFSLNFYLTESYTHYLNSNHRKAHVQGGNKPLCVLSRVLQHTTTGPSALKFPACVCKNPLTANPCLHLEGICKLIFNVHLRLVNGVILEKFSFRKVECLWF